VRNKTVIIGGGFYGLSVALYLYDTLGVKNIDILEKENTNRIKSYFSTSRELYLNLLKNADLMIGNSSSGICEAHAVFLPVR